MNDFLKLFSASLKHMRPEEKQDILQDFHEHFEIGLAAGKTQSEIANELGNPQQLARMFSAERATDKAIEAKGMQNVLRMLGAVISFKIGGGLLIFLLYFVTVSIGLMLFALGISLVAGGAGCAVLIVLELIKGYWAYALLALFGALALTCGGLLWWKGAVRLWEATVLRLPLLALRITRIKPQEGELA